MLLAMIASGIIMGAELLSGAVSNEMNKAAGLWSTLCKAPSRELERRRNRETRYRSGAQGLAPDQVAGRCRMEIDAIK